MTTYRFAVGFKAANILSSGCISDTLGLGKVWVLPATNLAPPSKDFPDATSVLSNTRKDGPVAIASFSSVSAVDFRRPNANLGI